MNDWYYKILRSFIEKDYTANAFSKEKVLAVFLLYHEKTFS